MSLADDFEADAKAAPALKRPSLSADMENYSPTPQDTSGPSPVGGWVDNASAGAGKAVYDIGRGVGGMLRSGLETVGQGKLADKAGFPTKADIDESQRLDAPLMNTGAGQVGYVGGNVAATMIPFGAAARVFPLAGMLANPTTYSAAALSGAINGALQPVGSNDSRARNMALGAATGIGGNAVINGIGRVAQPAQAALDPARQRAAQVLQAAGVPMDAAQLSGGTFLNKMRSSFSDNPFTAGAQGELIGRQRQAFNNAVLGTIGEHGGAATQEVMGRAANRIEGVFRDVLNRNHVNLTDPLITRIGSIQQAANDEERHAVSNIANRFVGAMDDHGNVPGQAAYNIKKDLDRLASSSDSTLAYHARQLRSAVMDGINDSLPEADRQAFSTARQQFGNMKKIEPAIDKEGAGNISPAMLANVMGQKANRQASIYGRGNQGLVELAQSGKMLLGDKTPNSGTTARAAMQLLAPVGASIAGGSYDAYQGDYGGAAQKAALAAGMAILYPKAAQYLINRPASANYLANGIGSAPLRSLLTSPQNSELVGGTLRRLPGAVISSGQ